MTAGAVPPNDLDAEAALLSAVLCREGTLERIEHLRPEHLYSPANRGVLRAALELQRAGTPVDSVTVCGWLKDRDQLIAVGGVAYVAQLVDVPASYSRVEAYADRIVEKARRRSVITLCHEIAAEGYGDVGDPDEWITSVEVRIAKTLEQSSDPEIYSMHEAIQVAFKQIQDEAEGGIVPGVRTGLRDLDRLLGSLKPGGVTTVAGFWGGGKSALALQIAAAASLDGGVGIISPEMTKEEIAQRAVFSASRIDSSLIRRRQKLTPDAWSMLSEAAAGLARLPIWIDDRAEITATEVRAAARRFGATCKKNSVQFRLLVVDYLQLVDGRDGVTKQSNREQEVAYISRTLKKIAKESNVHVLALAQLNDDSNSKGGGSARRPSSRDMRESKAIAQNSDNVILIHNPHATERAHRIRDQYDPNGNDAPGCESVELIIDKHRGGSTGTVRATFWPQYVLFEDHDGRSE